MDGLQDLLSALGTEPASTEPVVTEPAAAEPVVTEPVITEPQATEPVGPEHDAVGTEPAQVDPVINKQNKAFAEMRVVNTKYANVIRGIGQLLGADEGKAPEEILELVQNKLTEAQAEQQKVPLELLQKVQFLEGEYNRNQQQTLQQQAMLGFQNVKNEFGLNDDELGKFAQKLADLNINPFDKPTDLKAVYQNVFFDDIMNKKIEKALADERARAAKAGNSSTQPSSSTGGEQAQSTAQIKSATDLSAWFNKQNSK